MKLLFTLLFALPALLAQAQKSERLTFADLPVDSASHLVTYSAVVPVAGSTKEQLFTRAKEWAARSFADSKVAARMDDREAGTYITRGTIKMPDGGYYNMLLALYTKDGRYKYVIDQISYTYTIGNNTDTDTAEHLASYGKMSARYVSNRVKDLQVIIPRLAADIQAAMQGGAGAAKSNW